MGSSQNDGGGGVGGGEGEGGDRFDGRASGKPLKRWTRSVGRGGYQEREQRVGRPGKHGGNMYGRGTRGRLRETWKGPMF